MATENRQKKSSKMFYFYITEASSFSQLLNVGLFLKCNIGVCYFIYTGLTKDDLVEELVSPASC